MTGGAHGAAQFSEDGVYRYTLTRRWGAGRRAVFIMLNPSTADADVNDPTVARCCRYARDWGMGQLLVLNLFALRSTDPRGLRTHPNPVGPENDHVFRAVQREDLVVAAWGTHGAFGDRDAQVLGLLRERRVAVHYLRLTKNNHPAHPLYLPASLRPTFWVHQ
jgi:hypothetical protein